MVNVVQGTLDSFDVAAWRQLVAGYANTPVEDVVVRSLTAASVRPTTEVQTVTEAKQKAVKARLEAACRSSASGLGQCEAITADPPILAAPSPPPSPPEGEESSANLLWLLLLLLLPPLAWVAFVHYRHKGKVGLYWKWRTTHSIPTFNPRYMPHERRKELEEVLFGAGSGGDASSGVVAGGEVSLSDEDEDKDKDKDNQEAEVLEAIERAQASSSDSTNEEKKDMAVNSAPTSSGDSGHKDSGGEGGSSGDDAKKSPTSDDPKKSTRPIAGLPNSEPPDKRITQYRI